MITPTLRYLFISFFFLVAGSAMAQFDLKENYEKKKGYLYFENRMLDFGLIKEEDGVQTIKLVGWNIAKDPVIINLVNVACGCTEVNHSKDTLSAGDSVVFWINYDPKGQKGKFDKPIYIFTNGLPHQVFLNIKGEVKPREKTVADKYAVNLGNLKVTSSYHDFGYLYETDIDTFRIGIYNQGQHAITFKGISGRPSYIILNNPKMVLEPGEEGVIEIVYDARQVHEYGDMIHYLTLLTDDYMLPEMPLNINAHILETFPKQTRRRIRKNPKVEWENKEYDYGKVLKGDTVRTYYTLTNKGKNPLIIRRIQPSCGCTGTYVETLEIPAGQSVKLYVEFSTLGREGEDLKVITVITNDPAHPVSKLYLKGQIVENPNAL